MLSAVRMLIMALAFRRLTLAMLVDGVELLLSMLEVVGTFGEELPASCEDTCSQSWVVIDAVLSRHGGDPTISESMCRLLRAALPFFGPAALPVIPLVVKRAVLNFSETGIASYPWILRKCIEAHGHTGQVALREDFKQAYELVSTRMSSMLQTQSISNIPDGPFACYCSWIVDSRCF
jgi:transportin-3